MPTRFDKTPMRDVLLLELRCRMPVAMAMTMPPLPRLNPSRLQLARRPRRKLQRERRKKRQNPRSYLIEIARSQLEQKAIAKIKASKQFQRRRKQYGSDDDMSDEDEAARAIFEESMAPLPGQMENCELCEKRFSVTAYSRAGPDGGLLCPKCSKELGKEEGSAKKKRKIAAGRARRQLQSNLLDGIYPGAKDLMTLCIETLAKNVHNADSLGDLSDDLVDKIAAILSKKRLMTPETLYLFLRPGSDTVTVYDAAKLSSDDFIRIFQIVPTVKHLRLRNAIQFKNKVMDHLLGTTVELETLSLHGSNLIDDGKWDQFLTEKGSHLRALKVYSTDGHFGDEQLEMVAKHCPNLHRLKVCHNQKVTTEGVHHIAKMPNLTHLSLELYQQMPFFEGDSSLADVLGSIGAGLRTLSLATIHNLTNDVLKGIHDNCQNLSKLRLTDNSTFTDDGFANLFTGWLNPPLIYLDLHKCRHIDAAEPRENPNKVGLGSAGFEALMAHSGLTLKHLNVHSCRHISREAFENVFAEDKTYPEMQEIDISFCQSVNDFVVGSIFRSCPNLKTLKVFGNFGVKGVRVPKGKILIGVPNALGMQIEGTEEDEGRVI
jgi:DNA repair protein RAD7